MRTEIDRVLFAGGGTGGHVYMAIALADLIQAKNPSVKILFAGAAAGLESQILPHSEYELKTIQIGGLKSVGLRKALTTLVQLIPGMFTANRIVRNFGPSLIVGVGGYASALFMVAGKVSSIPLLLIEPNVFPGFTNRILARWVDKAAVAYEETATWFGTKATITGIPVRDEFFTTAPATEPQGPLRLLVFGGSRGSVPINDLLCEALPHLSHDTVKIVHQTGYADYKRVAALYENERFDAEVLEYIEDMPSYFANTDVIVSRAGASTVAEVTAAGRPSILIPLPHATDDHQRKNAEALASRGAALLLDQHKTSGQELADTIVSLQNDRKRLTKMAEASRKLARPNSTAEIVKLMEQIALSRSKSRLNGEQEE
jgi:UDP-N-acetylglucosamine--N-acetylmuramyl-(pentapeptide) pyrophosphoryl-undecaprenol N-acetylglucosamine transferase